MIPTRIGQLIDGGRFTGFVIVDRSVFGVILAPASEELACQLIVSHTVLPKTSTNDGAKNSNQFAQLISPAVNHCVSSQCNGFTDWYLPSAAELLMSAGYFRCNTYPFPSTTLSRVVNDNANYTIPSLVGIFQSNVPTPVVDFYKNNPYRFLSSTVIDDYSYLTSTTLPDYNCVFMHSFESNFGIYSTPWSYDIARPYRRFKIV